MTNTHNSIMNNVEEERNSTRENGLKFDCRTLNWKKALF